jgi:hypothetical protein
MQALEIIEGPDGFTAEIHVSTWHGNDNGRGRHAGDG